jgi:hypothetical protein
MTLLDPQVRLVFVAALYPDRVIPSAATLR